MSHVSSEYKPRTWHMPTNEEVFIGWGIPDQKDHNNRKSFFLLNYRFLLWLQTAAVNAQATLAMALPFYPSRDALFIEPVVKELRMILGDIRETTLSFSREQVIPEDVFNRSLALALFGVGIAGNTLNNTCTNLPEKLIKPVLESRDMCAEAIRQPRMTPFTIDRIVDDLTNDFSRRMGEIARANPRPTS